MPAEEGRVRRRLVPADEEFGLGVAEEASDIGAAELDACHRELQQHRRRRLEMRPLGHVVASPHRRVPLGASEEGAGEDEGAAARAHELLPCLRRHRHVVPVQVVHVPMLDVAVVQEVLLHRDLGAVEDRGLVHVVPGVEVLGAAGVVGGQEARRPVVPHLSAEVVEPGGAAGPAVPLEVLAVLVLHKEALPLRLRVHRVLAVDLEMRVDDDDCLAPAAGEILLHLLGVREQMPVPGHVALADGVLDVEPQHVIRDVMLVELRVHLADIGLVLVVPAALVVPEREERRHELRTNQLRVLALDLRRGLRGHEEQVHDAALTEPVRPLHLLPVLHVHIHLCAVEEEHAAALPRRVRQHQRHRAVQCLVCAVIGDGVLEHIQVVKPVRLVTCHPFTLGVREGETRSALGEAIHMLHPLKVHVDANRRRAMRSGVTVGLEALFPETVVDARDVLKCTLLALVAVHFELEEVAGVE
mmetsp:Transcript_55509/g.129970  ORF Transcript_55509/g.129970 Transcript_55509/m.129970 type:complete len:471 (+) Transcript_55509:1109-2521(+)